MRYLFPFNSKLSKEILDQGVVLVSNVWYGSFCCLSCYLAQELQVERKLVISLPMSGQNTLV